MPISGFIRVFFYHAIDSDLVSNSQETILHPSELDLRSSLDHTLPHDGNLPLSGLAESGSSQKE